jgi:hypothetical protein
MRQEKRKNFKDEKGGEVQTGMLGIRDDQWWRSLGSW